MTGLGLAGGLSSRFGNDKSRAVVHGGAGDMVDFSLEMLCRVKDVQGLAISCRPDQTKHLSEKGVLLIPDEDSGRPTPLRGLVAALRRVKTAVLAVPCDLPLMTPDILNLLVQARMNRMATELRKKSLLRTTFIDQEGFIESLIGIYEPESLPFLEDALAQKRWGIWSAVPAEGNCLVPRPDSPAFLNMNTPEDFAQAVNILKHSTGEHVH